MGKVWERQIRSAQANLLALMKKSCISLSYESLMTFSVKTESINNVRPLIVKLISYIGSEAPLCQDNLQTMKSNVVLPRPRVFPHTDEYSHRKWRRVQHIASKFLSCWRKNFFIALQSRQKWNKIERNFKAGDIVS